MVSIQKSMCREDQYGSFIHHNAEEAFLDFRAHALVGIRTLMKKLSSPGVQSIGYAVLSSLSAGLVLMWVRVTGIIHRIDPHDLYDSRIGMMAPFMFIPLLLSLVLAYRAYTAIRRTPSALTWPIIVTLIVFLAPAFLSLFYVIRYFWR